VCENVAPGESRGALCLNKYRTRSGLKLNDTCLKELLEFFGNHLTQGSPKNLLRSMHLDKACSKDMTERCPGKLGGVAFACLRAVKRADLEPLCQSKVFDIEEMQARTIELAPRFYDACRQDLSDIKECAVIPKFAPMQGKKACLMKHQKDLSSACSDHLFKRLKGDLRDARLMPVILRTCRDEIKTLCGNVAFGEARVLKCLWEKQGAASYPCQKQVILVTRYRLSDYRLDYRIRTRCTKDITTLCAREQWRVDNLTISELYGDQWQEGKSGQVLQCLKRRYKNVTSSMCKSEIQNLVRSHAKMAKVDPVFMRRCKANIATFCPKTKPERIHFCLRNYLKKLDKSCADLEIIQGSLAAEDIRMKPMMQAACSQAIPKFCGNAGNGDAQVIQCLQDHLEEPGLGGRCTEAVSVDLEASNHDWRLKFGVHNACLLDASRLCASKVNVAAGSVLLCLKANLTKINGAPCKAEIFRYVRQGASNIKFAPGTYAACVEDVDRLCKGVQPGQGRIHACLVSHKNSLSTTCSSTEFLEQKLIATNVMLHPKARRICRSSMNLLCKDIANGAGRVWQCLSRKKDDPQMAPACRTLVSAHERLQNYEFSLNPQLKKHCSKEAVRLCPLQASMSAIQGFGNEGATISCLIAKRDQIRTEACKDALRDKQVQRLSDIDNSPDAKDLCAWDIVEFCSQVPKNQGHGEVHNCLRKNMMKLSLDCKMAELDLQQMANEDMRLNKFFFKECVAARKRFCLDVQPGEGHLIMCMLKRTHHPEMEPECRENLVKIEIARAGNIRFNPALAKNCQEDLLALQRKHKGDERDHCRMMQYQDVALTGLSIDCLTSHRQEVKKVKCKQALQNVMRLQSSDLRAKHGMHDACKEDLKVLCPGVEAGQGRWHQCLRKNITKIRSKECKDKVEAVWRAEKKDAILNPGLRVNCKNEMAAFCPDVQHGEERILVCLYQHDKLSGFRQACKDSLRSVNPNVTVAASQSAMQALLAERTFWDRWSSVMIGGIAVLLSLWILALGFVIKLLRSRRSLYGVQVDQPEAVYEAAQKS